MFAAMPNIIAKAKYIYPLIKLFYSLGEPRILRKLFFLVRNDKEAK